MAKQTFGGDDDTEYVEEEKPLVPVMPQQRPVVVSKLWSRSGREEIMLMRRLWQRRVVLK